MKHIHKLAACAIFVVSAVTAHAGGWGTGAFENDDALDYVLELQEYDAYEMLQSSLGEDCSSSDYIDAMVGARAIASAEIIAAIRGNPAPDLPDDLTDVVASLDGRVDTRLVGSAVSCVRNVLDTDRSELAQLWREVSEHDDWKGAVKDLLKRLQDEENSQTEESSQSEEKK